MSRGFDAVMHYPSRRGPGMVESLSAISFDRTRPGPSAPAVEAPAALGHVIAICCLLSIGIAVQAGRAQGSGADHAGAAAGSEAGRARVVDVARFGFPAPGAGRYLATTVRASTTARVDVQAMLRSQRDAISVAMKCTGTNETPRLASTAAGIGGPSGGLIFALTVIDHLDGRDLARGRTASGTGELRTDGAVLPVGGVAAKAQAAESAGADLFLVPLGQVDEAEDATVALEVIGVRTVDEAVEALSGQGCAAPRGR